MTERLDDLVRRLEDYGVPAHEGRLYFHLCRLGRARAAELAKEADVPRTDAYRLLDSLVERGYVEKTLERPARFVPVPVDEVLERALRRKRRDLDALEDERAALARAWPRGEETDTPDRRIAIHQGRHQIQGLLERIITSAREGLTIAGTMRGLAGLDLDRLMERLRERHVAGVRIHVLTRVDLADAGLVQRLAEVAVVRHLELGEYHEMVIADSNQIALFVGGTRGRDPEGGRETLLSLTAPPFVMAQKALVDAAWNRGIDLADRMRELRHGELSERVELLRGRWMRTERLKQMLYRNEAVHILAPAQEVERWRRAGVLRVMSRRIAQGCTVRVLTDGDADLGDVPVHRVPHAPRLMATDGEHELLVVEGCDDGGGLTDEAEWGLWTSIRASVAGAAGSLREQLERAATVALLR